MYANVDAWVWEAIVCMIQVVADCILKSGQKREPVCPDEMIQALDYFNIPETFWPEGLIAASAVSQKYDIEACRIMDTIKGKVMAMAKDKIYFDRTQKYSVYRNSETGPFKPEYAFRLQTDPSGPVLQLPEPLKERIQALADKAFLQIQFNPKSETHYNVSNPSASSWSFTIKVHSLSSDKGLNTHRKVASVHQMKTRLPNHNLGKYI